MPKIDLYLLQKPEETQFYDYLPQSESWHSAYKQLHGESLVIHSSVLTESILPFITHPLVLELLEQEDLACLPLVFAENNLYCKGRLPTLTEWEELTHVGISIQELDESPSATKTAVYHDLL